MTSNERDAFEVFGKDMHWFMLRNPYNNDLYCSESVQMAWDAWRAARTAPEPRAVECSECDAIQEGDRVLHRSWCSKDRPAQPPGDGWTAVTERLPAFTEDQREFVLVYSETHDWMGTQFAVMRVADFYFYDPDCPEEMGTADADVVTHWKPLTGPALTKEV